MSTENSNRAQKIFDDLATGFACIQVTAGINMSKAVHLLNDLALLFKAMDEKPKTKGPIGYELSPIAEEATELINSMCHPFDVRATRLLEIIEVMDVEILSRGIALSNSKSNELTGASAPVPAKQDGNGPSDGKPN